MVVVCRDLLGLANPFTSGILNYETSLLADNVWNIIHTFNADVVDIMMEWILENGGIYAMERDSIAKLNRVYDLIDNYNGFVGSRVEKETGWRSRMNVPICVMVGDEVLRMDIFLVESPFGKEEYLRASLYHSVSYDKVVIL